MRKGTEWISSDFDYDQCFTEMLRVCKIPNILIFCSNKQVSRTMSFFEERKLPVDLLVWNKTNPIPACHGKYLSDVEFVVYVHGKGATFNNDCPFDFKKKVYTSGLVSVHNRLHPTQKSVEHIRRYIRMHCPVGGIVLDPFMGSGTTAIAAMEENCHFTGFEINEEYYRKATDRIKAHKRQLTLF